MANGAAVVGVRALMDSRVISGSTGFRRSDVSAAYPGAPDECTGFQIAVTTPRGPFNLRLEVQTNDGTWHPMGPAIKAHGKRWRRPYALGADSPEELLAGQLALRAQHGPRSLRSVRFASIALPASAALPAISVVTPSFNQAPWLEQTMLSVLHPGTAGLRYVVCDGGSTDGSAAIIRRHDPALHAWVVEPDAGQADAIAKGFKLTTGGPDDLMAWLNADDLYLSGALDFVRRYFTKHPEVDVVYGNRVLIDENGAEVGRWHLPAHEPEVLKLYDFVPQETLFWRRRIWDKVGGLNTSLQFAMDWDLLLRFQSAGAVIRHIPRFLAAFRLHPAQKSAAQIGSRGQSELDELRRRTFGRDIAPTELIHSAVLQRYLKRSARFELLARWGWIPAI